ncbi:MAG: hypothetical protein II272_02565 [Oscillospiraceae bacterium]|nr:hypothetical protein [Oscillospiraceae bacterium]
MKIGLDKSKEALAGMVQNTVDFGKKAVNNARETALAKAEKRKNEAVERDLKKYNPLFPEQYRCEEFHLPKVIVIVDDAERRDIEVCKGAMGWRDMENKTEILYLYEKDVEMVGLSFFPGVKCNHVYCADQFDPKRYIQTTELFGRAMDEKVAELKHIAWALGAKKCVIEYSEFSANENAERRKANFAGGMFGKKASGSADSASQEKGLRENRLATSAEYEGSPYPQRPTLKWFANTDTILHLIESRCNGTNVVKKDSIEVEERSSATISGDMAAAIDATFGKMGNLKGAVSMSSEAAKEQRRKMTLHIEF